MQTRRLFSRRNALGLMAMGAVSTVLGACGAQATPAAVSTQPPAAGATPAAPTQAALQQSNLVYYYLTGGGTSNRDNLQPLLDSFTTANPMVKVEQLVAPEGTSRQAKLQTMIAGGDPPDVVVAGLGDAMSYAAKGILASLSPLLDADGLSMDDWLPTLLQAAKSPGGDIYTIPHALNAELLYYNKNLFEEGKGPALPTAWDDAAWTYDALLATLQTVQGNLKEGYFASSGYGEMRAWTFPFMNGGKFVSDDLTTSLLDKAEAYGGLQWLADLLLKEKVAPTAQQAESFQASFMTNRIVTDVNGTWSLGAFAEVTDFQWGIAPIPRLASLDVKALRATPLFPDGQFIFSKDRIKESWALVKYLVFDDSVYPNFFWNVWTMSPARKSFMDQYKGKVAEKFPDLDVDLLLNSFQYATWDMRFSSEYFSKLYDATSAQIVEPVMLGDKTAEEACTTVNPTLNDILAGKQ